jgi:rhodanese-related sulfurtransferase
MHMIHRFIHDAVHHPIAMKVLFRKSDGLLLGAQALGEGAINIPLGQLRDRLEELPRDKTIHVICRSGQRAYYATRLLLQKGFDARNVSGGMLSKAHSSFLFQERPIE